MIVTLSPAKLIDFETSVPTDKKTLPLYTKEADEIAQLLKDIPMEEIPKLMSVNRKIAMSVYQQIQAFDIPRTPEKQAGFVYNGIAYQGLKMNSFSEKDIEYAQEHLIILSGLYGALRPLDIIKPHRLEMQIKLVNNVGSNLYDYWIEKLTSYLSKRLEQDDNIWVNLMSSEYTKVINSKKLPSNTTIITPNFKQETSNGLKQIVVYTKKARGMMARYILKNRITDVEDLKGFDTEGYMFAPEHSTDKEWTFVR